MRPCSLVVPHFLLIDALLSCLRFLFVVFPIQVLEGFQLPCLVPECLDARLVSVDGVAALSFDLSAQVLLAYPPPVVLCFLEEGGTTRLGLQLAAVDVLLNKAQLGDIFFDRLDQVLRNRSLRVGTNTRSLYNQKRVLPIFAADSGVSVAKVQMRKDLVLGQAALVFVLVFVV